MEKPFSSSLVMLTRYLQYYFSSRHKNGHGIHSPFVYEFTRKVVANKGKAVVPGEVSSYHAELKRNRELLELVELGAGSRVTSNTVRPVSSIARKSSVSAKQGAFLYRLVLWYRPAKVIELGTGLGISTAYLAAGAGNANIISVEGSPQKHNFALQHMPTGRAGSLELLLGHFDSCMPQLLEEVHDEKILVVVDGDHTYASTTERVRKFIQKGQPGNMIIVLDDIYWSEGMARAWKEVCREEKVSLSVDLFHFGILFLLEGFPRQHFKIKF